MLIDTHTHLQFRGFDTDRDTVVKRCQDKPMILNLVGTQKDTSRLAVELAEKYDWMFASIGVHPNHLFPTYIDEKESKFMSREEDFDEKYYEALATSKKVIGVGECGLDLFHIPKDIPLETVLEKQKRVFMDHIRFAEKHDLALVIHCRDGVTSETAKAHDETIKLLQGLGRQIRGTVHCFTSGWGHAEKYLELGLHLGFTGVITYPPKKTDPGLQHALIEVVEKIPLDRIVVETDSPYLAPQAYRGERCEPWMAEEVVKRFAEVRKKTFDDMSKIIELNTRTLFRLS